MNITRGKVNKAQKTVIYGVPGIGKTTLASQFPNPLFIDTEGSTNNLDVARMDRPTSYQMLLQQLQYIKNNTTICKTLIIDTIDWAYQLLVEHVCTTHNKKGIEEFGYGQGYMYAKEELGRFLNVLTEIVERGINIVLLAHAQVVKFELPEEQGAYDKYQLKLSGKGDKRSADLILEWADLVLFCNFKTFVMATDNKGTKHKAQGNQRMMYATYNPVWEAKNRHNLPDEMPLGYQALQHIFHVQDSAPNAVQQPIQQAQTITQNTPPIMEQTIPQTTITTPSEKPIYIPQALWDLMQADGIVEHEVLEAIYKKGFYPQGTEFVNLAANFIQGALVANWEKLKQFILNEVRYSTF